MATIGTESITVGNGSTVSAVMSEVTHGRQYGNVGFDAETTLDAVVFKTSWTAAGYTAAASTYIGKVATARGLDFRVESVSSGVSFVTLRLSAVEKA